MEIPANSSTSGSTVKEPIMPKNRASARLRTKGDELRPLEYRLHVQ